MAKRKYVHTPQYNFKHGLISLEEYNRQASAKKQRKKYDVSKRVGAKRGKYYGYSKYQKELQKQGVRPGAKVPQNRRDFERAIEEQLKTPLPSGQKVTRQQALTFLVQETTYSDNQVYSIFNNINEQFQDALVFLYSKASYNELIQLNMTELGTIIDQVFNEFPVERDLCNVVWSLTNSVQEFLNWKLTASDIRGNTPAWQKVKNIVDYYDDWDDVYGS